MTFFPVSLKALAILAVAALAGVAVALTRPKPIDSAVLGSEWQCHETAFVITTCALRTQRQAVPALETTSKRDTLWPDSIAGKHVTHLSSTLAHPLPDCDFHHRQARGRALMSRALGISGPSM